VCRAGDCEGTPEEEATVDFTGTWDVVSSPDFDEEYLRPGGAPYVTFRQNGEFVNGEYEIGVMGGTINGGAHSEFVEFPESGTRRDGRGLRRRPRWKANV
jgi:hypothetical protein